MNTYADIILPLAIDKNYTYAVPETLVDAVAVGKRVEVQFGQKRVYAGVVKRIFERETPFDYTVKPIINVLDQEPILLPQQMKLWEWIKTYYMCTDGDVMNTALPSAFKLSSETKILLNPSFNHDFSLLNDAEFQIAEALTIHQELTIEKVQAILQRKQVYFLVKSLIEKGVVLVKEELIARYKPKMEKYLALNAIYEDELELQQLFERLSRARKQLAVLMAYIQYQKSEQKNLIAKKRLIEKAAVDSGIVRTMLKKGIFTETEQAVSRLQDAHDSQVILYDLTQAQQEALAEIYQAFEQKAVVLLHGVTSSGKTQVYIKLIKDCLAKQQQVLYLLPEIALTAQMIARLRKVFGSEIGVYHSKFNDQERVEIWQKVLHGEYKIVVGPRSALFLPFKNLGLIIVDEEHDASYKQQDPAPRYHARDTAIYLASLYKAKTVLGSATPALESYYNATIAKKYALVTLLERYGNTKAPEILLENVQEAAKQKRMKSHFSDYLINTIQSALDQGEQVIIFQNRRGYSPYIICDSCTWIPQCYQCDVSLTYHKYSNQLKCHYCGYFKQLASKCEVCESTYLRIQGYGTEKLEDEIKVFFPNITTGRLDLETARTKTGFEQVIQKFEDKKINILVGTQMLTKGLDFDNVNVVGIVSADQLLNFPDFRAAERAFQLMLQVSGRAGRRDKQGKVIIQTLNVNYPVLTHVINHDYLSFFQHELYERQQFLYPPFKRIIKITIKHKQKEVVNEGSFILAKALKEGLNKRVLGPSIPLVPRVRNYYLRQIIIKLEKSSKSIATAKQFIQQTIQELKANKQYRALIVQLDVDPQ